MRLDDLVVALLVPGQLERDVGEHLVGVHVGRGAGPALIPVDLELVVIFPFHDGVGGHLDRRQQSLFIAPTSVLARAAASFTMAHASMNPG